MNFKIEKKSLWKVDRFNFLERIVAMGLRAMLLYALAIAHKTIGQMTMEYIVWSFQQQMGIHSLRFAIEKLLDSGSLMVKS